MTLELGNLSEISSQASIPEPPGSRISMTTTSGREGLYLLNRFASRAGFRDHFEIGMPVKQSLQSKADNLMIIHQ